ncbi:hypothetical protein B0T26DRAFT_614267, partial [Lasiosphaeria miniovina]
TVTGMLRQQPGPILLATEIGSTLWWQTAGGKNQPRSRAMGDSEKTIPVSETLQSLSGQGGASASAHKDKHIENDPKNTKIFSVSPDAPSKRNPDKARNLP